MLCPRGWIVPATLALVLWLPVALALALSRDFGAFNSSDSWTVLQAEVDQYFELNGLPHVRQAVLALNAWTAGTLSWEQRADGSVRTTSCSSQLG